MATDLGEGKKLKPVKVHFSVDFVLYPAHMTVPGKYNSQNF